MGFKDAEWAYSLELPMREKVVLVAVCHRTDDSTHQTFVGQQTIRAMLGCEVDYVRRALRVLERTPLDPDALAAGYVIDRTRRHGVGGYRTSDLITVNVTYPAPGLQGPQPTRLSAYEAVGFGLTGSQPEPTQPTAGAEEIIQYGQPEDHPEVARKPRKRATRIPDEFIVTGDMRSKMHAEHPGLDIDFHTRQFVDYWRASSGRTATKTDWVAAWRFWMRRSALDTRPSKPTPTQRAEQTVAAGRAVSARQIAGRHIASLELPAGATEA